jgi:hypothetical protein
VTLLNGTVASPSIFNFFFDQSIVALVQYLPSLHLPFTQETPVSLAQVHVPENFEAAA